MVAVGLAAVAVCVTRDALRRGICCPAPHLDKDPNAPPSV
jgi:hypothetical protein